MFYWLILVSVVNYFFLFNISGIWDLLWLRGIPGRTAGLLSGLCPGQESAILFLGGVRQGSILAPSYFNPCLNRLLGGTVNQSHRPCCLSNPALWHCRHMALCPQADPAHRRRGCQGDAHVSPGRRHWDGKGSPWTPLSDPLA